MCDLCVDYRFLVILFVLKIKSVNLNFHPQNVSILSMQSRNAIENGCFNCNTLHAVRKSRGFKLHMGRNYALLYYLIVSSTCI